MREILFVSAYLFASVLSAQQPPGRYAGAVLQGDAPNRALLLRLDSGAERWVAVPPHVDILRITPGERDLGKASKLLFEDVRLGDRVLARSDSDAAGVAIASQVLVLSHAELVRRQASERADWKARGVTGRVSSVDVARGEIVVVTPPRPASKTITLRVSARTEQRRYRPDSARYSDALAATLANVRAGDQVQALGDWESDGVTMRPEKLVSGSFRNFTAKLVRVDAAQRLLTLQPVDGGAPLAVRVGEAATLRRLRPEDAAALASARPAKTGDGRHAGADPQMMLDASPAIALQELRPGDAVIVATGGNGEEASPLPAVAVIAGAEPLLKRSAEAQRELIGSWDLSLDPGEPGGRGGN